MFWRDGVCAVKERSIPDCTAAPEAIDSLYKTV